MRRASVGVLDPRFVSASRRPSVSSKRRGVRKGVGEGASEGVRICFSVSQWELKKTNIYIYIYVFIYICIHIYLYT